MGIKVIKGGLLTTVQDLGRYGFQKYGMVVSGAMDGLALRLGNIIVGNAVEEAGLECTMIGPTLYFDQPQLIALTGGDLSPKIDGRPIAMWKPIFVDAGAQLSFGKPLSGCRTYICFAGGLAIPEVLGSRSTYLKAKIGGLDGRALQKDDYIAFRAAYKQPVHTFPWQVAPQLYPNLDTKQLRVVKGPHYDAFTEASIANFFAQPFTLTTMSDRMGYRLACDPLALVKPTELLSSAVTFGTVQVPPQGEPIVLMADRATTGGYPVMAQVAQIDWSLLAQKQPADQLQFQLISLDQAHRLLKNRARDLQQLKRSIALLYER